MFTASIAVGAAVWAFVFGGWFGHHQAKQPVPPITITLQAPSTCVPDAANPGVLICPASQAGR